MHIECYNINSVFGKLNLITVFVKLSAKDIFRLNLRTSKSSNTSP